MNIYKKLWYSTRYSTAGLKYALKNELAFKLEVIWVIILSPLACFLARDLNQLILLLFSCYAVLIVELINTAIESVVDRIGLEHHELSKNAKDAGSAAVFVSLLLMILVWGLIIYSNFKLQTINL